MENDIYINRNSGVKYWIEGTRSRHGRIMSGWFIMQENKEGRRSRAFPYPFPVREEAENTAKELSTLDN